MRRLQRLDDRQPLVPIPVVFQRLLDGREPQAQQVDTAPYLCKRDHKPDQQHDGIQQEASLSPFSIALRSVGLCRYPPA